MWLKGTSEGALRDISGARFTVSLFQGSFSPLGFCVWFGLFLLLATAARNFWTSKLQKVV